MPEYRIRWTDWLVMLLAAIPASLPVTFYFVFADVIAPPLAGISAGGIAASGVSLLIAHLRGEPHGVFAPIHGLASAGLMVIIGSLALAEMRVDTQFSEEEQRRIADWSDAWANTVSIVALAIGPALGLAVRRRFRNALPDRQK
jgi:hypothetical protein